jgi:hypothetical protein
MRILRRGSMADYAVLDLYRAEDDAAQSQFLGRGLFFRDCKLVEHF